MECQLWSKPQHLTSPCDLNARPVANISMLLWLDGRESLQLCFKFQANTLLLWRRERKKLDLVYRERNIDNAAFLKYMFQVYEYFDLTGKKNLWMIRKYIKMDNRNINVTESHPLLYMAHKSWNLHFTPIIMETLLTVGAIFTKIIALWNICLSLDPHLAVRGSLSTSVYGHTYMPPLSHTYLPCYNTNQSTVRGREGLWQLYGRWSSTW